MSGSDSPGKLTRGSVLLLLAVQVAAIAAVIAYDVRSTAASRALRANSVFGLLGTSFKPPAVGSLVAALRVKLEGHPSIDLTASDEAQCIVLVGRCESCARAMVHQCDQLWREGKQVVVVSRSEPDEIRRAAARYGWRLPIYSETTLPDGADAWKATWRPWLFVVKNRRVLYAQTAAETWQEALERARRIVSKPSSTSAEDDRQTDTL